MSEPIEITYQLTPEQIRHLRKWKPFSDLSQEEWEKRLFLTLAVCFGLPIEDEIAHPKMHWLVWVHRNNPRDVHIAKRTIKWKTKIFIYRIAYQCYSEELAKAQMQEYLNGL